MAPYSLALHIPSTGFVLKQVFIAVIKLALVMGVFGHVPQTGVLVLDNAELVLNSSGVVSIFGTHQPDIS